MCNTCPLRKFEGGLNLLHKADDDAVIWLESTPLLRTVYMFILPKLLTACHPLLTVSWFGTQCLTNKSSELANSFSKPAHLTELVVYDTI